MRFFRNVRHGNYNSPSKEKLSLLAQLIDVRRWLRQNGLEPGEYYLYDLCRSSLTATDRERYISRNQIYLINKTLNPQFAQGVANSKLALHQMLTPYGIPMPRLHGVLGNPGGRTSTGEPLRSLADFKAFLGTVPARDLFFKPASGNIGHGIRFVKVISSERLEVRGDGEMSSEQFFESLAGSHHGREGVNDVYLVEERLIQHSWLDRFTTDCAQTMRVVLYITQTGQFEVLMSILKIGVSGKFVDNVGTTGLAAPVFEQGRLGRAGQPRNGVVHRFDNHPETSARITGEVVPFYDDVIDMAKKAHSLIPQLRSLGWDIAITNDGPVVLEANTYWSHLLQFVADRGAATPRLMAELNQLT